MKTIVRACIVIALVLCAGAPVQGLFLLRQVAAQSDELPEVWATYLAWNEAEAKVAAGYTDGQIKIWDTQTGQLIRTIHAHTNSVTSLAWSPEGLRLASGGNDGLVKIWDGLTGNETMTLSYHQAAVQSVRWSPDGSTLVSVDVDGNPNLYVFDANSGQILATTRTRGTATEIRWSPDGTRIAFAMLVGGIDIWDATALPFQPLVWVGDTDLARGSGDMIFHLAWSSDGTLVAGGAANGRVRVWKVQTGELHLDVFGNEYEGELWRLNGILALQFSPDDQILWSASNDGTVRSWTIPGGEVYQSWSLGETEFAAAFSLDASQLVHSREPGDLEVTSIGINPSSVPNPW